MSRARVRLLPAVAAALVFGGCLASPFERINPNDPDADFTITLTASADSSRTVGEIIDFVATVTPPAPGFEPEWSVSHPALVSLQPGRYQVVVLPPTFPLLVVVTARFAARQATYQIWLRPAIP